MIPQSQDCEVWASPNSLCVLWKLLVQYDAMTSTSKFPFHCPLVIKHTFLDYENGPFTLLHYFVHILYLYNTHKLDDH